jgi:hypothetical protein
MDCAERWLMAFVDFYFCTLLLARARDGERDDKACRQTVVRFAEYK